MRCMITAKRRARATIAFLIPRRLAICIAQALSQDKKSFADYPIFTWRFGDRDACGRLFASAAHVVDLELRIPRIVVNATEPDPR
jgi:hypothetical protein